MRIAMLTDSYYPTRDGVVTSITTIRKSLEDLGHEVWVVAPDPGEDDRVKDDHVLWLRSVSFKMYKGYFIPVLPSADYSRMHGLDLDVIHVHGVATMAVRGLVLAHYLKIPVVMTFHTMVDDVVQQYSPINLPEEKLRGMVWLYLKNAMKRMDAVIAPTEAIGKELTGHSRKIRLLRIIPTGVNTSVFRPGLDGGSFTEKYGLDDSRKVLFVGRISFEKEIDMAIRAMRNMEGASLIIAGAGPQKEELEGLVGELGMENKVKFLGFVPDADLPYAYAAADAAVSCSRFETQGLSVLEAMASGLPCACRNARAFTSIIRDGENGFLFDGEEECAAAIEKALNASDEVRKASLETARDCSAEVSVEKTVDLYKEVIAAKKKRLEGKGCSV
ncbi:MAG: 1,2-diacylglycerol 3-alpha-glucosyltransferase [Candidatus Methanomethylophilaceae archaeon]|nr:1,2-diacylglycerol 3-alpha-glucosyltransferase [Candidatus Methanomethylophilaceae archaeon]